MFCGVSAFVDHASSAYGPLPGPVKVHGWARAAGVSQLHTATYSSTLAFSGTSMNSASPQPLPLPLIWGKNETGHDTQCSPGESTTPTPIGQPEALTWVSCATGGRAEAGAAGSPVATTAMKAERARTVLIFRLCPIWRLRATLLVLQHPGA